MKFMKHRQIKILNKYLLKIWWNS